MQKVVIGRFGAPHGIRGWIRVNSFSDPITNILDYQPWQINTAQGWQTLEIESGKLHGKIIVVKLPNCETPEQAARYTNLDIAIERNQLPQLTAGSYYWSDLIGLTVINQEHENLGTVDHLIETGANDVLVVIGERERLIPYIKSVILAVDLDKRQILVDWDKNF